MKLAEQLVPIYDRRWSRFMGPQFSSIWPQVDAEPELVPELYNIRLDMVEIIVSLQDVLKAHFWHEELIIHAFYRYAEPSRAS